MCLCRWNTAERKYVNCCKWLTLAIGHGGHRKAWMVLNAPCLHLALLVCTALSCHHNIRAECAQCIRWYLDYSWGDLEFFCPNFRVKFGMKESTSAFLPFPALCFHPILSSCPIPSPLLASLLLPLLFPPAPPKFEFWNSWLSCQFYSDWVSLHTVF